MRWRSLLVVALVTMLYSSVAGLAQTVEPAARSARNGGLTFAGRTVSCDKVQTLLDRDLPNLGAAAPDEGILILNPLLLRRYSGTVQLFVFNHECGHHRVGASELGADCWAVKRGVREGWLDKAGLGQVCRSFDNAPVTDTHPSGTRRCANLDRCFALATTELAQQRAAQQVRTAASAPKLIDGPRLLWSSR